MITDKAFADSLSNRVLKVVTPGKGRVEHRSFFQLNFTHNERVEYRSDVYYQVKKKRGERGRKPPISVYFLRPVRLAAMLPTLRPGGACLLTVVGRPGD